MVWQDEVEPKLTFAPLLSLQLPPLSANPYEGFLFVCPFVAVAVVVVGICGVAVPQSQSTLERYRHARVCLMMFVTHRWKIPQIACCCSAFNVPEMVVVPPPLCLRYTRW